jgi:hypothetical protein
MIYPRHWISHMVARRALRDYPLYAPPHKGMERDMTEAKAEENFDYFMSVRRSRLAHFAEWMNSHFAVKVTLDGSGLTAISNWADKYGGGLLSADCKAVAPTVWATYRPTWNNLYAGFNVMIDIGIFQGEYLIARRPQLVWEMYRRRDIEPSTFDSEHFRKPCLGGFSRFWNGFPLRAGASAIMNGRGLATFGDHMARRRSLIADAQSNLYLSKIPEGTDPIIIGDYSSEPI